MIYKGGEPVAEVVRSGFVEGGHRGSVVALDGAGGLVDAVGDVESPIFPRSSNKPLQAIGMLRAGLRLVDPADLALVCASHYGEDFHVARVASLLRSAGLDDNHLRCPPDMPLSVDAAAAVWRAGGGPARIRMNCSGKHAGMLLTCVAAGFPLEEYVRADHPLQERITASVEQLAGVRAAAVGVDGCGAPVLALPLRALASAFLRLVSGSVGSLEATVAGAMRSFPEMVSGTGTAEARLMRGVPGLLAKGGAEGVLAVAVPGVGAVAVKIDDGAMRARYPVVVSGLRKLGVTAAVLDELAEEPLLGGGARVGAVRSLW